jgi:flagellar L-ring protein precursor FlgH
MCPFKRALVLTAAGLLFLSLPACSNLKRLGHLGDPPPLTPMGRDQERTDKRVALPMPAPDSAVYEPNSLWRSGARAFFKDQRAAKIGDILTIDIEITDKAELNNETDRSRDSSEKQDLSNFLGFEGRLGHFLPDPVDPTALVRMGSVSATTGAGSINREEKINLTVAAIVTQLLPNGNLVIQGRQEVRVNNEKRDLYVSGVVRPEDISNTNTIKHTQIAEARISYGGQGILTDMQKPRYGQEAFDLIFPF